MGLLRDQLCGALGRTWPIHVGKVCLISFLVAMLIIGKTRKVLVIVFYYRMTVLPVA
jgi:hypothetical protein